ncbi:unnamed protein product, partial [Symbiodinium sp. CCMP2456]
VTGKGKKGKGKTKQAAEETSEKGQGKGKSQTKGSAGEAPPKGKGKTKSPEKGAAEATKGTEKGAGKTGATGETQPKGKGKAKSPTKGSGKQEATAEEAKEEKGKGESQPKGKGKAKSPTKGSGKQEATGEDGKGKGESQPKGKGKAKSPTKGSGKQEATGEQAKEEKGVAEAKATVEAAEEGKGNDESQTAVSGLMTDAGKAPLAADVACSATSDMKVQKLTPEQIEQILNMTARSVPGLKPGLLEKWKATKDPKDKFSFLKAFIVHKDMNDVEVETYYIETTSCTENWLSLPLSELRKLYTGEVGKKFLEEQVVAKQRGVPHPQDTKNPEMRIYTVFQNFKEVCPLASSANKKEIGSKTSAVAKVPGNKAARAAFAEALDEKEITPEEQARRDFQKDLQQKFGCTWLRTLGEKATTAATNLKSTGMKRQEEDIKHMGEVNEFCWRTLKECNGMLFSAKPISHAKEYLESKSQMLQVQAPGYQQGFRKGSVIAAYCGIPEVL